MNIREALQQTTKTLSNIHNPSLEARILLQHILNVSQEYLIAHGDNKLSMEQIQLLQKVISRRQNYEPIAYIIGYKEFYGRDFFVTNDVLIPRPDSETLIECILNDYSNKSQNLSILDLGTGSGCLIITLLLEIQNATATAIDINQNTLEIAYKNAKKHNIHNDIEFILSDWFESIPQDKPFDIIISNPPYITSRDHMAQETLLYEPEMALFDKKNNGKGNYDIIAKHARSFLKPEGVIYLEIGYDQEEEISNLYIEAGYNIKEKKQDIGGHVRCLKVSR